MVLHELITGKRAEVILSWKAQVQGKLAPESTPPVELVDHMPQFLGEIIAALRQDAGLTSIDPSPDESAAAAEHGEQRLRLGFSLDAVVREYGALHTAIVTAAIEAGSPVTFRELQVVFDSIVTGIAHAVSEYARQRDAELSRLANEHFAFVAHELRNPLATAKMSFMILKDKGRLPLEDRAVGSLERGLNRLEEQINQTLQVARVASGIELRRRWTTLTELVQEAELGALPEAEGKGVELRLTIEHDQEFSVDSRLVHSALSNLLRNAVKYSKDGGLVQLRAKITDGRIVLEVEDSCGGLPPGKVEEAFAPFVRLDSQQSGFGLGLAIAKQAVDAHGGSIRVQNIPHKGCIFVLELPLLVDSGPKPG